jgi:DNA repair protein SbcD/Mre11
MDEFEAALDQVVGIAISEGADAVLVAGDIYEHRAAPPDADQLVFDSLLRLHAEGISVVAIPGNHDSAPRLESVAGLLRAIDVSVAPKVSPPDRGGIVAVPSRDGSEVALVACVPFVPVRRFASAAALFEAPESWYQSYAEGMGNLLAAMAAGFRPDRVNVLLAHLYASGALLGGGEREVTIGADYAVSPGRLPAAATYIALGHIHRPQRVEGSPAPARYAGSVIQLDFGEREQKKSVAIVEARPGKPARVREVPLTAGRSLVDVQGTLDELAEQAGGLGDAHLRVFVNTDGPVPGMADRVRELLPGAVDVHLVYQRKEDEKPVQPVSSLIPRDQFLAYYRSAHAADPDGGLMDAFDEAALALEDA